MGEGFWGKDAGRGKPRREVARAGFAAWRGVGGGLVGKLRPGAWGALCFAVCSLGIKSNPNPEVGHLGPFRYT